MDAFWYLWFMVDVFILFCLFCAALCHQLRSDSLLALLCVMFSCIFCLFSIWRPGSGAVPECISSWSFPSSLPFKQMQSLISENRSTSIKIRKNATTTRNNYNQIPHLTQDITWESYKNTSKHHSQKSRRVQPLFQQMTTRRLQWA